MTAARFDELPRWARELIEHAPVGRLGLLDFDDAPRVLPITFAIVGEKLWTAVDSKPKRSPGRELVRVRWLRRRPGAALTVDRYDDDWSRLAWVQALGQASIEENAPEDVLEALVAKYRQYEDEAPGGPFIGLEPRRFVHWRAGGED